MNDKPSGHFYRHNNGDLEPLVINGFDGKGMAWVTWKKDGFKNMVPVNRFRFIVDLEKDKNE